MDIYLYSRPIKWNTFNGKPVTITHYEKCVKFTFNSNTIVQNSQETMGELVKSTTFMLRSPLRTVFVLWKDANHSFVL